MKLNSLIGGVLLAAAPMAFAGGGGEGITKSDLQTLKQECRRLQENEQIKPFNTLIICREVRYTWEKGQPTTTNMKNNREVGGEIKMKSFVVPYVGGQVQVPDTTTECSVLERYKEVVGGVEVSLSCDELQQVESLDKFCTPHIDDYVAQNPSAVQREKTGEIFNTCSGLGQ